VIDPLASAFLQQRLATFARRMFFAFLVLRVAEFALYRAYDEIWPNHYWTIFAIGAASVGVLGIAWLALVRLALTRRALVVIDLCLTACCGGVFGAIAILASNRPESAYTCLVYAGFVVLTRTIVVPSSGLRTVIVAGIAMLPLAIAALVLAIEVNEDVPGVTFFGGGLAYTGVAVALAATGSRVIYGLRARMASLAVDELELGQYRLVRKLGEGATGEVFAARHALLRRPTAVKLIQPSRVGVSTLARCELAVQQMSRLRHHNTVAVFDYGRSLDGVFYLAMEYLDGIALDVLVDRYGPQPPGRAIAIVVQLCGALHEAHQLALAHGNLKLSNVILCERGGLCDVAKLTDFGFGDAGATAADDLRALGVLARSLVGDHPVTSSLADCFAAATSAKGLASALRGLAYSWPAGDSRSWWAEYRRASAPFLPVATTLPVDLARREVG
jgi:hypothetical protein